MNLNPKPTPKSNFPTSTDNPVDPNLNKQIKAKFPQSWEQQDMSDDDFLFSTANKLLKLIHFRKLYAAKQLCSEMKHRLPLNPSVQTYWKMLEQSAKDQTTPDDDLTSEEESLEDASEDKDEEDDEEESESDSDEEEIEKENGGEGGDIENENENINGNYSNQENNNEKRQTNTQNLKVENRCTYEHNPFQDRCKKRIPINNTNDLSKLALDQPSTRANSNKDSKSVDNNSVSNQEGVD